jgi:hypothetical protein
MVGQQTKLVDSHMYFLNKNTKKKSIIHSSEL